MTKKLDKLFLKLPILVVVLGVFLRLKILIENRSLFIDEASLARNLAEKSYLDFFTTLSYEQYAPPLFMVESKLMIQLVGNYEWAMRIIPFIAGLGSMWLLWSLLNEWMRSPLVKIYGLSLFCFSFLAIRYGTEFKQYSGDAFLSLAFVWLAWKYRLGEWQARKALVWAGIGSVGIWYSMPLVFTLTGVGMFFLLRNRVKYLQVGISILTWLLSFGFYYFLILGKDIGSEYLENFFNDYFFNVFSFSGEVWANNLSLISDLFRNVTDKTAVSIGFGMMAFGVGVFQLVKEEKQKAVLLLLPVLSLFCASVFHYYNLMARLTVFILPILTLIICHGVDKVWSRQNTCVNLLLAALMLVGIFNKKGLDYITEEMTFEEIMPCLQVLQEELTPSDYLFVDHQAVPAFEYYRNNYQDAFAFPCQVYLGSWDTDIADNLRAQSDKSNWILFSHTAENEIDLAVRLLTSLNPVEVCRSPRVRLLNLDAF